MRSSRSLRPLLLLTAFGLVLGACSDDAPPGHEAGAEDLGRPSGDPDLGAALDQGLDLGADSGSDLGGAGDLGRVPADQGPADLGRDAGGGSDLGAPDQGPGLDQGPTSDLGADLGPDAGASDPDLGGDPPPPEGWTPAVDLGSPVRRAVAGAERAWVCREDGAVQPVVLRFFAPPVPQPPLDLGGRACEDLALDEEGGWLYVAAGLDGTLALDLAGPQGPVVLDAETAAWACVFDAATEQLFVAGGDEERSVLSVFERRGPQPTLRGRREGAAAERLQQLIVWGDALVGRTAAGQVFAGASRDLALQAAAAGLPGIRSLSVWGEDLLALSDAGEALRLAPDAEGRLAVAGPWEGLPGSGRSLSVRGGLGICACGPGGQGLAVLRRRLDGTPQLDTVHQRGGLEPDLVLALAGGRALATWGGRLACYDAPPVLVAASPRPGSQGYRPGLPLRLEYSEPVAPAPGDLELRAGGRDLALTVPEGPQRVLRLTVPSGLSPETEHELTLAGTLRSADGQASWPPRGERLTFTTGPELLDSPLETGLALLSPGIRAQAAMAGARSVTCDAQGKLVVFHTERGVAPAPLVGPRLGGRCRALAVDSERGVAYAALGARGVVAVDLSDPDAPRRVAGWLPPWPEGCDALTALPARAGVVAVCGARLVALEEQGADLVALAEAAAERPDDAAFVAASADLVVTLDGSGRVRSFRGQDLAALEQVEAGAAPLGLSLDEDRVTVADAAGGLWELPVDSEGHFGAARALLEQPGLRGFCRRKGLLAVTRQPAEPAEPATQVLSLGLFGALGAGADTRWEPLGAPRSVEQPLPLCAPDGDVHGLQGESWSRWDPPPYLMTWAPEEGAVDQPLDLQPLLRFSEPVLLDPGALTLWAGDRALPGSTAPGFDVEHRFTPAGPLPEAAALSLRLLSPSVHDATGQPALPAAGLELHFFTLDLPPRDCAELDCAAALRTCTVVDGVASCGACLAGYHAAGDLCAPDTCADRDCAGQQRACDETGAFSVCGACLAGYHAAGDLCAPDTCADLDCAGQQRACDASGAFAVCGACLPYHREDQAQCRPDTCADLDCAAQGRACDDSAFPPLCGDCLPLWEELDGACVPGPCLGLECGPDGRGGTCGACDAGWFCRADQRCAPFNQGEPDPDLSGRTVYLDAETLISGRPWPDMPSYPVQRIEGTQAFLAEEPAGIAAGDEILLVNLQGSPGATAEVGLAASYAVAEVDGLRLSLHAEVEEAFGPTGNADLSGQRVVALRVPHYPVLALGPDFTLTAHGFDGERGGVLAFAVDGLLRLDAAARVTMEGRGYPGGRGGDGSCRNGTSCAAGVQGTSLAGPGGVSRQANLGGGGGGGTATQDGGDWGLGGGGGSHKGLGGAAGSGGLGGLPLASPGARRLLLGSGGGGGGADASGVGGDARDGTRGGLGGGLVWLRARALLNEGELGSGGGMAPAPACVPGTPAEEPAGGGGGAGGSLYLLAEGPALAQPCALPAGAELVPGALARDEDLALRFDGAAQWGDCGAVGRLATRARSSAALWLRAQPGSAGWLYVEEGRQEGQPVALGLALGEFAGGGAPGALSVRAPGLALSSPAGSPLDDDAWHFVVLTRQGTAWRLFVDGQQVASASLALAPFAEVLGSGLAGSPSGADRFAGALDELALFPHALEPAEIRQLHVDARHGWRAWEPRLLALQPGALWRLGSLVEGATLAHPQSRSDVGLLDVDGAAQAACRCGCGGAGGAGRAVLALRAEDADADGVPDLQDNCFLTPNADQVDGDGDGLGDACEVDWDGDGVADADDAFPEDPSEWQDSDGDGVGDQRDCRPADPALSAPQCAERDCGSDGCGGSCGDCDVAEYCSVAGRCVGFELAPPAFVSTAVNLSAVSLVEGRPFPDIVSFPVQSVEGARVQTGAAALDGLLVGDELLLVNLRGSAAANAQVGVAASYRIEALDGGDIVLERPVLELFGPEGNLDLPAQGQIVVAQRVPHYAALTVSDGGSVSAAAFDGSQGGVLALAVDGPLQVDAGGQLSMAGAGYRGGCAGSRSYVAPDSRTFGCAGESFSGTAARGAVNNLGGGGGGRSSRSSNTDVGNGGGGGSYRVLGTSGIGGTGPGLVQGAESVLRLYLGSGGGGGGADGATYGNDSGNGSAGGPGGGALWIRAQSFENRGALRVDGGRSSNAGCTPGSPGHEAGSGGGGAAGTLALQIPRAAEALAGSYEGGAAAGAPGALAGDPSGAVALAGGGQRVALAGSLLADNAGSWTVSLWFRSVSETSDQVLYEERGATGGRVALLLNPTLAAGHASQVALVVENAGGSRVVLYSTAGLTDGSWHQVAAQKTERAYRLLIDGSQAAHSITSSGENWTASNLGSFPLEQASLGGPVLAEGPGTGLEGSLDEVAVFAAPLSFDALLAQVAAARAGSPAQPAYEALVLESSPQAYWRFDDAGAAAACHPRAGAVLGPLLTNGAWFGSCSCRCGGRGGDGRVLLLDAPGDADGDGVADGIDGCPLDPDPEQPDADGDGVGDACDPDRDGDGVPNAADLCPLDADPEQGDADGDGQGDACDLDADGDGVGRLDDCDETDPRVFAGAIELCNGRDDDCDEAVDEDPACATCRDELLDGHIVRFCDAPLTWAEAGALCQSAELQLIALRSPAVEEALRTLLQGLGLGAERWWTGGNDLTEEGRWTWADGSLIEAASWAEGQPDDPGALENCLAARGEEPYGWSDEDCGLALPFVCEEGDFDGDGLWDLADPDDDNDGLPDSEDPAPRQP